MTLAWDGLARGLLRSHPWHVVDIQVMDGCCDVVASAAFRDWMLRGVDMLLAWWGVIEMVKEARAEEAV